jgi:hypothetical protein
VPPNKQLQRTGIRRHGAAQAGHFILHLPRAGYAYARPLKCGVMRRDHTFA